MNCIICNAPTQYFFSKKFEKYELGKVDYHKCTNCGFGASKTHFDMSEATWTKLNVNWHHDNNAREDNPYNRNQRYYNQALMIYLLKKFRVVEDKILDWGSGVGSVSMIGQKLFDLKIINYDEYITPELNPLEDRTTLNKRHYNLVTSNAVFEHITSRSTLDDIESNVSLNGCLGVHTLIPENIPNNPDWMYLLAVHCAFHTNKSMQILMDQWGYQCSAYNELSKMWMLFKRPYSEIKPILEQINKVMGWNYLKHKEGFMDYWK